MNVLGLAESYSCRSVAIPFLSSNIFGFPMRLYAKIIYDAIEDFIKDKDDFFSKCEYLEKVNIVILNKTTY
jgi:O-acetyl-ADP-ribose deacetylase (regulator of RNase III)